jgi:superfamily II DNA helicase RecQ
VATVAFGLGVDIPDVRHIFLYGLLTSPAETWQMIGRCGRDGEPASAHLYLSGEVEDAMKPFAAALRSGKVLLILYSA